MITYEYECTECKANFDVQQSIKDDAFTWCPECEAEGLRRVLHLPLHVHVLGTTNATLGSLADRNARNMSADAMRHYQDKRKTKKTINRTPEALRPKSIPGQPTEDQTWIKKARPKTHDQVASMTPTQVKKYVETGD